MALAKVRKLAGKLRRKLLSYSFEAPKPIVPLRNPYPIQTTSNESGTAVDGYWGNYTIKSAPYASAKELLDWLQWRSDHFYLS